MKTLYVLNIEYGQAFYDDDANLIHFIHENDGCWRHEYFGKLAKFFDGRILKLDLLTYYDEDAELSNPELREAVVEAIAKARTKANS